MAAVVLSVLVVGCAPETALEPTGEAHTSTTSTPQLAGGITPMCQLGCIPPGDDPNPTVDGEYVGSEVSAAFCADSMASNDVDQDGMSDYCEKVLAAAFAPSIRYANTDDLGRESYWAARQLPDGKVRLFYAIAYYFDLGVISSKHALCELGDGWLTECDMHNGDSESIVLDVYFNPTTSHWLVDRAWYSHHKTPYNEFGKLPAKPYPLALTYPGKKGGAPLAWVARNKHANYQSQAACNNGGGGGSVVVIIFPFDDCTGNNTIVRLDAFANRNLGSNSHRFIDCVNSTNPFYQDPAHPNECFWSRSLFYGWQLDHTTEDVEAYGPKMRSFGF